MYELFPPILGPVIIIVLLPSPWMKKKKNRCDENGKNNKKSLEGTMEEVGGFKAWLLVPIGLGFSCKINPHPFQLCHFSVCVSY